MDIRAIQALVTPTPSTISAGESPSNDPAEVARVRQPPTSAERAAMKKAATEFESFFLYYMLKTMRQAVPKGGLLDSKVGETYMGMLDQEVANQAAKQGGFGLAKSIERQFYPPLPGGSSFPLAPPIKSTEGEGP
jgi:Rod binding domain-containing protein